MVKYALIGDIHSSKEDLEKVLKQIKEIAPEAKVIGTGDLFECTVSKKDITDEKFTSVNEVMLYPEGFVELLTFPTVFGNQEERILRITESREKVRTWLKSLPEVIAIDGAEVIHGHQWQWGGDPWHLQKANQNKRITFFGHSHTSALCIDGKVQRIDFDARYDVSSGDVLVNVGAVVGDCEWVLYEDCEEDSAYVTFLRA